MLSGWRVALRASLYLAVILWLTLLSCRRGPETYRISAGKEGYTHTISEGETLESIAEKYYQDTSLGQALGEYNGIDPTKPLQPGTTLLVPFDRTELEQLQVIREAQVFYNKGTVLARTGQYEEASRYLESAVEANPAHVDAWYNLALVYNKLEKPERASEVLRKLVNSFPSDKTYHYSLGAAMRKLGRSQDALEEFEKALGLDPAYREAQYALALTFEDLGNRNKAILEWQRYLEIDQESIWSEEARLHLEALSQR